ncbi:MAG TPA: TlpA disulfide reductase family protein [Pyrinomonadaceae bacterium]|nr:TlpA disulfide reductase family protein [Pyrinomonadaceae bacterium]
MPMSIGDVMPRLEGATEWFNATGARAEAEAKGHPTLVYFWAVSCDVCKANMPRIAAWREEHRARGLRVVAVHVPRTEDDGDVEIIREALSPLNITEPCAVDNERKLSEAFQNERTDVPAYYLFDREGKLACSADGERGPDIIASALETSLMANEGTSQVK